MLGKRADGGLTLIVVIVIIIFSLGWLIDFGNKECKSNNDCTDESYCGSDNACHQIPVIEKTPTVINRDYGSLKGPAAILALAIVIAAVVLRTKKSNSTEDNVVENNGNDLIEPAKITELTKRLSKTTKKLSEPTKKLSKITEKLAEPKNVEYVQKKSMSKTDFLLVLVLGATLIIALMLLIVLVI